MPRTNESGQRLVCSHCGWTWYYTGNQPVTSCPRCKWRVRAQPTQREMQDEGRQLIPSRNDRGGFF